MFSKKDNTMVKVRKPFDIVAGTSFYSCTHALLLKLSQELGVRLLRYDKKNCINPSKCYAIYHSDRKSVTYPMNGRECHSYLRGMGVKQYV